MKADNNCGHGQDNKFLINEVNELREQLLRFQKPGNNRSSMRADHVKIASMAILP
jgi:hypothetical protein